MNSRSVKEENIHYLQKEKFTFSLFVAIWLIFSIPLGAMVYYVTIYSDPYRNLSSLSVGFLLILFSQNMVFPILIELLPISPIDISYNALKKSFFHKLMFICTSPILLFELYLLETIIESIPMFSEPDGALSLFIILSMFPIVFWMLLTLWIWQLINGKESSRVLKIIRKRFKDENQNIYQEILSSNFQSKKSFRYPIRWAFISVNFPFLIWIFDAFLNETIIGDFVSFVGLGLFLFLWVAPFYLHLLSDKGYYCMALRISYNKLFGKFDTSTNIGLIGTLSILLIPLIYAWIYKIDEFNNNISFLLAYIFMVFIFLGSIFSNQIKRGLGINDRPTKQNDDEYITLFK